MLRYSSDDWKSCADLLTRTVAFHDNPRADYTTRTDPAAAVRYRATAGMAYILER